MKNFLKRLMAEEEGQGIVEYTLILGLLAIGIYAAVAPATGLTGAIGSGWGNVAGTVGGATS